MQKMANNHCKFDIKTIKQVQFQKVMKKLKKKKGSGINGLSQEKLILGVNSIVSPLTAIMNQSITDGEFPKVWKQALVTPVLQRGNAEQIIDMP